MSITKYAIIGLGNPLLDVQSIVDEEFFQKYQIQPNNAILAEEQHLPMYDELCKKSTVEYIAGGATQNAIRVCQWMLNSIEAKDATIFFGGVGKDQYSEQLRQCAQRDGVRVEYLENSEYSTGTCAVCINQEGERSLIANLAAANHFTLEFVKKHEEIIKNGKIFYSSGFHLTVCPEAMEYMASYANKNGRYYCINLAAPFILQFMYDRVAKIMPYADFVFGNETEALEFGKTNQWGTDLCEIAKNIAKMPKNSGFFSRTVVITQGSKNTIVCHEGKIYEYSVAPLTQKIVDTNGAGDAFVGGFLSALVQNKPIEECIDAAHYAASVIIMQSGCSFPSKCEYVFKSSSN